MISGALLQRYCPDNGQCSERTDPDSSSSGSARRRLLALLLGRGSGSANASNGSSSSGWLRSLAEAAAGGEGEGGGGVEPYVCNGRALWSIVGAITLSSPLLVLLMQVGIHCCCCWYCGCCCVRAAADAVDAVPPLPLVLRRCCSPAFLQCRVACMHASTC